jgi:hypothetical protein
MQGAPSYEEQVVEQQDAADDARDGLDMAPHLIAGVGRTVRGERSWCSLNGVGLSDGPIGLGDDMPVIVGAHSIIYSKNAEADRALLRDVIGLPNVDVGDGWLIFALPPAEVAVHPGDENDAHEFYLMVKDLRAFLELMKARSVACTAPRNLGWGVLTEMSLPAGASLVSTSHAHGC